MHLLEAGTPKTVLIERHQIRSEVHDDKASLATYVARVIVMTDFS